MGFNWSGALSAALPAITQGQWGSALAAFGQTALAPAIPAVAGPMAQAIAPAVPAGVAAAGAAVGGAVALVRMLLAKAAQFLGRRVTKFGALDLIRRYGPTAAASALGWSAAEAVQFWMAAEGSGKARRRRGITGRQIANARATARRVAGAYRSLYGVGGARGPRPAARPRTITVRAGHKAGCGCFACRRA